MMRITYACHLNPSTSDLPLLLARALRQLGVEIELLTHECEGGNDVQLSYRALTEQRLHGDAFGDQILRHLQRSPPDLFLYDNLFFRSSQLSRLERLISPQRIGFFLGYNHLLVGSTTECLRRTGFVIVHDSYLLPLLRGERDGRSPNVFLLGCAADPLEHRPLELTLRDRERFGCDVAFIGGWSPNREALLAQLQPCQLKVWGDVRWRESSLREAYQPEPVYGLKKTKIYNAARVVLNVEDHEKQVHAVSQRVPEVLACGTAVLTEDRVDLARTGLRDGVHLATFSSPAQARQRLHDLLSDDAARTSLARSGRAHVLQQVTYRQLAESLVADLQAMLAR